MSRSENVKKKKIKKYELAEHFLRLLLRCWLCVKMWRMWWVRFVHSVGDLAATCIVSKHLSHLVMFCRPAVCERHQEGWVQMPAVARYLFPLQSLQNQGGTLLLEDKMEKGHRVQYDDYLTFAKCANCFSGWGKVFHNSQWQGHLLCPLLWGQGIHEESNSYGFDPNWSQVATKCTKCKGVLTTGGVTFRGEPWHRWAFFILSFFWSPGSGRGRHRICPKIYTAGFSG